MRKIIIITGVLMLNLLSANGVNAQPQSFSENVIPASTLPALHSTNSEKFDDLKTELGIYSLIAGIYTLYWLKQRA